MNSIEDQVRAATRAQAATLREVRPLRLNPADDSAPVTTAASARTRGPRRMRPWLAPAGAAAAVVALAVSLVTVKSLSNGPVVPPSALASSSTAVAASAAQPRYYASVTPLGKNGAGQGLAVADTVTGKTVATVGPPAGRTFTSVSATADDRTFVAYALPATGSRAQAGTWYEVRFTPGAASPARLSRLRVPALASVLSMAVSQSGAKLAVVLADSAGAPRTLLIYSVTTGRLLHAWPHGLDGFFNSETWREGMQTPELSWIDGDRDVAFPAMSVYPGGKSGAGTWVAQIWHLNLSRGGSNLIANSGLVWSMNVPLNSTSAQRCTPFSTPLLSADGKTVVCVSTSASLAQTGAISYRQTTNPATRWSVAWLAFAISAPGTARTLYSTTVPAGKGIAVQAAWTNATSTSVLAEWGPLNSETTVSAVHFGTASRGAFTPYAPPRVTGTNVNFFLPGVAW